MVYLNVCLFFALFVSCNSGLGSVGGGGGTLVSLRLVPSDESVSFSILIPAIIVFVFIGVACVIRTVPDLLLFLGASSPTHLDVEWLAVALEALLL